jgi:hypothetical protein
MSPVAKERPVPVFRVIQILTFYKDLNISQV